MMIKGRCGSIIFDDSGIYVQQQNVRVKVAGTGELRKVVYEAGEVKEDCTILPMITVQLDGFTVTTTAACWSWDFEQPVYIGKIDTERMKVAYRRMSSLEKVFIKISGNGIYIVASSNGVIGIERIGTVAEQQELETRVTWSFVENILNLELPVFFGVSKSCVWACSSDIEVFEPKADEEKTVVEVGDVVAKAVVSSEGLGRLRKVMRMATSSLIHISWSGNGVIKIESSVITDMFKAEVEASEMEGKYSCFVPTEVLRDIVNNADEVAFNVLSNDVLEISCDGGGRYYF